jgi:hypothetical protein
MGKVSDKHEFTLSTRMKPWQVDESAATEPQVKRTNQAINPAQLCLKRLLTLYFEGSSFWYSVHGTPARPLHRSLSTRGGFCT